MQNIKNIRSAYILWSGLLCLLFAVGILAQEKPANDSPTENPLSFWNKKGQETIKGWIIRSAEKMPEENYSFKPTSEVRSFGQILGHIADMQYVFCASVLQEKNPAPRVEKNKTTKAEIIGALQEAFAFCDKAYNSQTDNSAGQTVNHYRNNIPKLFLLSSNLSHTALHYGNLVTYMRLKNIIPPSTEDVLVPPAKK